MTLATRCPACGTVFRVVQDQLRVSQGWVRCGRCAEAFNAMEAMVDWPATQSVEPQSEAVLSMTRPPAEAPAATDESVSAPTAPAPPPAEPAAIDLPPGIAVIASDGAVSSDAALAFEHARHDPLRDEPTFGFDDPQGREPAANAAAALQQEAAVLPSAAAAAVLAQTAGSRVVVEPETPTPEPAPADLPSFVLQADRAERWRRPWVRVALSIVGLLAAIGLVAQVGYTFRDRIAAASPGWRPLMQQACASLGCRVGEYRQIDALSVESSALVRVEGAPVYRLAVTLRNRAALDVAAPAIDLSLTDAQGRQIARRVLQMSDLNLPLRSLKAGSELPIQAPLSIGDRQVSGYTVEIFYP